LDILLAFPPLGNHEHVHVGLPILKAYLGVYGYKSCIIRDYNVEIMDRLVRESMDNDSKGLYRQFNAKSIFKNYMLAKNILRGRNQSDKLKTGWATDTIYRYLTVAGEYIRDISFDPVTMNAVEKEFLAVDLETTSNPVYKYIREELLPDVVKHNPKIIGFSVTYASQVLYTLIICRELRKLMPGAKIILGGAIPSIFWRAFFARESFLNCFDVIIREQGEKSILALAEYWLANKGSLEEVPNLSYMDSNKKVQANPIGENISMDDMPMPDFNDIPFELYAYPKLPYQMTRGCYWGKCAFCGHRGCNNKYLMSSKSKVVNEIKTLKDTFDIRIFHFVDDAILAKYFVDVGKMLISEGIDIVYSAFLRAENGFSKENCQILFNSGLRSVLFGFESANDRILNYMEKGLNNKTMKEILTNFKEAGISNHLSCIIGFPTETREEAFETIQFLLDNTHIYHKAYLTPFGLFSDMVNQPEKFHIYNVDINNPMRHDIEGYVNFEYDYCIDEGMTAEERLEVLREGRRLINSVPPGGTYFSKSL